MVQASLEVLPYLLERRGLGGASKLDSVGSEAASNSAAAIKKAQDDARRIADARKHANDAEANRVDGGSSDQLPTAQRHKDPFAGTDTSSSELSDLAKAALQKFTAFVLSDLYSAAGGGDSKLLDGSANFTSTALSAPFNSLSYMKSIATRHPSSQTAGSDDLTYWAVVDPLIPSIDVAKELDLTQFSDLLTSDEWKLYQDDPLCYFNGIEDMYLQALIEFDENYVLDSDDGDEYSITQTSPSKAKRAPSPAEATSRRSKYWELYESIFPSYIYSIHLAEPSRTDGATATAIVVSSTTCGEINGIKGWTGGELFYRQLAYQTPPPESSGSGSGSESTVENGSSSATAQTTGLWLSLLAVVVVLFLGY